MTPLYRIIQLKELEKQKQDALAPESDEDGRSTEGEVDTPPEPEESIVPTERPASLKGISDLDLMCIYTDGRMTEIEAEWFRTRRFPSNANLGRWAWMA